MVVAQAIVTVVVINNFLVDDRLKRFVDEIQNADGAYL